MTYTGTQRLGIVLTHSVTIARIASVFLTCVAFLMENKTAS